ncbi:MAG: hypothetical protein AB7L94_30875 [Kofleriaceae bacterium]
MGAILLLFMTVWLCSGYLGVKVLIPVLRPQLDPQVPDARIANTTGAELAYQRTTDLASRGSRKLGRAIAFGLGVFLLLWPIAVVYWFFTTDFGFGAF